MSKKWKIEIDPKKKKNIFKNSPTPLHQKMLIYQLQKSS